MVQRSWSTLNEFERTMSTMSYMGLSSMGLAMTGKKPQPLDDPKDQGKVSIGKLTPGL